MSKQMKLRGIVRRDICRRTFTGQMHDGTEFTVDVGEYDVEQNEPFGESDSVEGWLFVALEAQQDSRCYVTLPCPTLLHGHQMTVHEYQLMPRNASLKDFHPQKAVSHG